MYAEGDERPAMIVVGMHCRLLGRPGASALQRFLDHIEKHDRVWVCRRVDVARHWIERHHPGEIGQIGDRTTFPSRSGSRHLTNPPWPATPRRPRFRPHLPSAHDWARRSVDLANPPGRQRPFMPPTTSLPKSAHSIEPAQFVQQVRRQQPEMDGQLGDPPQAHHRPRLVPGPAQRQVIPGLDVDNSHFGRQPRCRWLRSRPAHC